MSANHILDCRCSGTYGNRIRLRNVLIQVKAGEGYVLIGPTGSGKTLITRLVAGLEEPTSGFVRVDGLDPFRSREQASRAIGYAPARFGFWPGQTVTQDLTLLAGAFGQSDAQLSATLALCELTASQDKQTRELTQDEQIQLRVARALVRDPDLLLIDAPDERMSTKALTWLQELLTDWMACGKATLLCTRQLEPWAPLFTYAGLIIEGALVTAGNPKQLLKDPALSKLIQRTRLRLQSSRPASEVLQALRAIDRIHSAERSGEGSVDITFQGRAEEIPQLITTLSQPQLPITGFVVLEAPGQAQSRAEGTKP